MAKSETGNPYTYDAEGQLWAGNLEGPDPGGSLKNTGLRIYVDHFVIRTGSGGNAVEILEEAAGKRILYFGTVSANDTITWPVNAYLKGIYINDLPTSAVVEVWHERN